MHQKISDKQYAFPGEGTHPLGPTQGEDEGFRRSEVYLINIVSLEQYQ